MKSNSSVEYSRNSHKFVKFSIYLGLPKLKGTTESSLTVTVLPQTGAASTLVSKGDSEIKHIVSSTKCQPRGSSAETLNRQAFSTANKSQEGLTIINYHVISITAEGCIWMWLHLVMSGARVLLSLSSLCPALSVLS